MLFGLDKAVFDISSNFVQSRLFSSWEKDFFELIDKTAGNVKKKHWHKPTKMCIPDGPATSF